MFVESADSDGIGPAPGPQPTRTLGVFDSGVGGLSVVREVLRQHPAQPIIYLADQAHTPYGQRSLIAIRELAGGVTQFLLRQGVRAVVVACNTASAAALVGLRETFPDVPFIGMEPAVKPAVERSRARRVGIIATAATFQGQLFRSLLARYAADVDVRTQVCPDLVTLVEAGELDSPRTYATVAGYLAPLLAAGIDELVLGCTHYPFLRPLIERVTGPDVEIIDPAPAVARQVGRVLSRQGWLAPQGGQPKHVFYTTGDPGRFQLALGDLLGRHDDHVSPATWTADGTLAVPCGSG
jgi:glutamate racemase